MKFAYIYICVCVCVCVIFTDLFQTIFDFQMNHTSQYYIISYYTTQYNNSITYWTFQWK